MPDMLVIVGGAAGGLALVVLAAKALGAGSGSRLPGRVKRAMASGDYELAASQAEQLGHLQAAYDLYVRAQRPLKAANVALLMGQASLAGELYERGGDRRRAAAAYRQAGMTNRANEIEPLPKAGSSSVRPGAKLPPAVTSPTERAEAAEEQWRVASKVIRPDDADGLARSTDAAEKVVELWLSAGEIKRAAAVCREAGLVEQAVSLYVNVLGDPGAAAQIVASRGDHPRAAVLYEGAGQKDKALQTWIEWSREADDPLEHLADVERLGESASLRFFQAVVSARPISPAHLDLYYRVGASLKNDPRRAKAVFERVAGVDPNYKDVAARIQQLAQAVALLPPDTGRTTSAPPPMAGAATYENMIGEAASLAAAMIRREAEAAMATSRTALVPQMRLSNRPTPASLLLAADPVIKEARRGPSVAEIRTLLSNRPAGPDTVELYYRLAIAQLAHGQYTEAEQTFREIEGTSPGYRDAASRARQLEEWKAAMAPSSGAGPGGGAIAQRYVVVGELGRGGMAVVYRARDEALGREVALKFLTEEALGNEVFMQFFQREARAAGSLNHPNIVTIYDVGAVEGRAFICMELVDGVSLDSILEKDKRLPLVEALRIAEQTLVALEYAHQRKIIHRDIKPANIMRTASGLVKLMDFGLAKSVEGQAKKSTVISGTPSYMPPEQLLGKGVDARADIFALGATLYELITGEVAFQGMVRLDAPSPVRDFLPSAPALLEEIMQTAMTFDKEARFASATDMLVPVRALLAELDPGSNRRGSLSVPPPSGRGKEGTVLGIGLGSTESPATASRPPASEIPPKR